jgi:uncharacterized membrane protein
MHSLALWAHILGIALFVGPQFFIAFAVVPATRGMDDLHARAKVMRTVTDRFLYIGGAGLALILIAGTYLISTWRDYYDTGDELGFMDVRYGELFVVKMVILLVMLVAVGAHTFIVGPKQLDLMEALADGEDVDEQLRSTRMRSMALSITGLVLTLVIMGIGASMTSASYSINLP